MPYQSHPPSSDHCHKFWRVVLLAAGPEQYCRCRVSKPQIPAKRWGVALGQSLPIAPRAWGFPHCLCWLLARAVRATAAHLLIGACQDLSSAQLCLLSETAFQLNCLSRHCRCYLLYSIVVLPSRVNLALKYPIFFCHGSWIRLKSVAFELSRNYLLQFVATYLVQQSFFPRYFAKILMYCHNLVDTTYISPFACDLLLFRAVVPRSDSFVNYKFRHMSARVNYVHEKQVFRNWVWG